MTGRTARRLRVAVCALGLTGCVARLPVPVGEPGAPRPFIITAWCGPPAEEFTDARAAEMAAAGFTVVGAPCEGYFFTREPNLRALDTAARHGLRMWIRDTRINRDVRSGTDWEAAVTSAVADYRHHPALDGYWVDDEPGVAEMDAIAQVVDRIRAADPEHLPYVNLFPDFVSPAVLGGVTYPDYVEHFIDTVHPTLLSYDHYPFLTDQDRPGFFGNLATIRAAAQAHHLPFMLIVQVLPHARYRDVTEAEIAWQVFHALAFGARGISYFTYWTPVNVPEADVMRFHYAMIEDGKPTLHYFQVARLNRVVQALARQLAPFDSLAVADSAGEIGLPFPIGPIAAVAGGPVTVGLFTDRSGTLAALLVNRDYRYGVTAQLRLRAGARAPEAFDVASEAWAPTAGLAFPLEPGGAQLIRWRAAD